MRTVGIRAKPSEVTFAVYDTVENALINVEVIKIPKALTRPDALKYARSNILDVIREYGVERAGIRITESNSQHVNSERIQLEGVIQEAFASSTLSGYYCGQISNISARIGIERSAFRPYVDGKKDFGLIENWETLTKEAREAALTAIGAQLA